jgi:hypothetical protein
VVDPNHIATAHDSVPVMSNPDGRRALTAVSASARKFFIATPALFLVIMFVPSILRFAFLPDER